jgi:hypothetical protein
MHEPDDREAKDFCLPESHFHHNPEAFAPLSDRIRLCEFEKSEDTEHRIGEDPYRDKNSDGKDN